MQFEGINAPGLEVTTTLFCFLLFFTFTFGDTFPILRLPCLTLPCSTSDRVYHLVPQESGLFATASTATASVTASATAALFCFLLFCSGLFCFLLFCSACSPSLSFVFFFSFVSHLFCSPVVGSLVDLALFGGDCDFILLSIRRPRDPCIVSVSLLSIGVGVGVVIVMWLTD